MNTILKNAISSIQVGVEDYKSGNERRLLSAVRNITSGILLLFGGICGYHDYVLGKED